jgi:hypothetical protein
VELTDREGRNNFKEEEIEEPQFLSVSHTSDRHILSETVASQVSLFITEKAMRGGGVFVRTVMHCRRQSIISKNLFNNRNFPFSIRSCGGGYNAGSREVNVTLQAEHWALRGSCPLYLQAVWAVPVGAPSP